MSKVLRTLALGFGIVAALSMSVSITEVIEAQRGGGGGGRGGGGPGGGGAPSGGGGGGGRGGGGPGGGKGGPPGAGKGGDGNPWKKGGVNSHTDMADWKQPRDSTWEKAKAEKLPIVMVFMPARDAANPRYYIGKDIAEISRGKSIWVQVMENHHQILKGEKGYKEPEPEPVAEAESDDAEAADASTPTDDKAPADDKAKSFVADIALGPIGSVIGQAAPAAPAPTGPTFVAPSDKLYKNKLWDSYKVTKGDTFLVLDHLGNEYKRWTEKPATSAMVAEINKMAKAIEKDEKQLIKDFDDAVRARDKGDLKGALKNIRTGFDRGRVGYEGTDKLKTLFDELLTSAREKKAEAEGAKDVKALEELKKLWAGTDFEEELTVSIAVHKGAKK